MASSNFASASHRLEELAVFCVLASDYQQESLGEVTSCLLDGMCEADGDGLNPVARLLMAGTKKELTKRLRCSGVRAPRRKSSELWETCVGVADGWLDLRECSRHDLTELSGFNGETAMFFVERRKHISLSKGPKRYKMIEQKWKGE